MVLLVTAGLGTAQAARADGPETDPRVAQSLFDDGRVLMEAGRYAEACPKFADSHRLDPAGGTLLNLALCHELEGRTATAWTEFREALSIAVRDQRKDREELAELHIATLAPKLTRLAVVVPQGLASRDPEITLDRSRLPSAAWNTPIAVDPGAHRIVVTARGVPRWETSAATGDAGQTLTVEVPFLEPVPADAPSEPPMARRRSVAFWPLLGGAGVLIGTSVVTGVMALSANAYVKTNCTAERAFCRVGDAADEASRARSLAWVSTATLLVGAGAVVIALLLPFEKTSLATRAGIRMQNGAALATFELAPLRW